MPAPTIANFFGATATVDTSNPSNPKLILSFTDFASVGFGSTAKASDAEAWLTAIVKLAKAWSATQTDELANAVVDSPFLGLTSRNNVNVREYSYSVRIYEPDTGAAEPDPDNV